jgi:dTDP-glucose 4,6-dehydratase
MSIFVTGGCGFIGSNFILDWFLDSNEKVINLDKLNYASNKDNLSSLKNDENYNFIHGDINDDKIVNKIFNNFTPRAIINFAAESHVDRSINIPDPFIDTNIVGCSKLLKYSKQYWNELPLEKKSAFRFLHISTDEVYGSLDDDDLPFIETSRYDPRSPYSASKAASDHFVKSYFHTYGLPILVTNCSNNFGPFQFPEKLIPLTIYNLLNNKPVPIYGDGKNIRDWLYVKDHCEAIKNVLNKGIIGQTYNIGGNNEYRNIDIVKKICDILSEQKPFSDKNYYDLIKFVDDRPGHDRRYAINNKKITQDTGWKPKKNFDESLKKNNFLVH